MTNTFIMSARQAAELDHAFERNGWTPSEVKKLSQGDMLAKVGLVLRGQAEIIIPEHVIDLDAIPFIPQGSTVEEHHKDGQFKWDPSIVMPLTSKKQRDGGLLRGGELRAWLKNKRAFNANLLDYLLCHQYLIPEGWKDKYTVFLGTIYRDEAGSRYARLLFWHEAAWSWGISDLEGVGLGSNYPVAVRVR